MARLVAIIKTDKVNQFFKLPKVFTHQGEEFRIVHLDSPDGLHEFSGEGVNCAFDLIIQPTFNQLSNPDFHRELSTVFLNRYDKIHQQRLLNDFMSTQKPTKQASYVHLGAIPIDMEKMYFGEFSGRGVMKLTDGARSMGIMKFDTEHTNLRSFLIELDKVLNGGEKNNRAIQKVCDAFKIDINFGKEYKNDEVYERFTDKTFMLQHLNPYEDAEEFRVIKTLDTIHMYRRDHFNNEDPNVTDRLYMRPDVDQDDEFELMMDDIQNILKSEDFPLIHGSIDIWVSRRGMKWGIYEYQNQYGHVHIPETTHNFILKDTIHKLFLKLTR